MRVPNEKRTIPFLLLLLPCLALAVIVDRPLPQLELSGKAGGRVDGSPFTSAAFKGKVHVIYYVDPDERDLNEPFYEAMKKEHFSDKTSQSVAVINLAATVMPDFLIEALLKKKQKKYPRTLYIKDKNKALVRDWGFSDNSSCVTVLDARGVVVYHHCGKIADAEIPKIVKLIMETIARQP